MDLSQIRSKLNTLQKTNQPKKEKVDYSTIYWKPKEAGKYQIRFVPSKFDKQNPFKEFFFHYNYTKFPIPALSNWGEKDPIIEFAKSLRATNDKDNWTLSKKLEPKMRIYAPIIVRGEEDKGVRLWEFGKEIYSDLLRIADDEDYGDYTDIMEGRDFTIDATKDTFQGKSYLKCTARVKPKTSSLSDDKEQIKKFLNEQPNVLEIHNRMEFDEIKKILQNWLNPEDAVETSEPETPIVAESTKEKPDYALEVKPKKKTSDKFDDLFNDDLPF
jgi:hypothetical protein